jgi:hypothetical protein
VAAVFTFDAGKTIVQIAAIEITIDYFFDIGPPEAVLPRETVSKVATFTGRRGRTPVSI